MAGAQCGASAEAHTAHPSAHSATATSSTRTTALGVAVVAALAADTGAPRPGRPLRRYLQVGRNRRQIQRFAHEVAQRDHQFVGMYRPPLCQFIGGTRGQPHLFVGAQQQDVRQRRFHGITDAARAIRAGLGNALCILALAKVTAMASTPSSPVNEPPRVL